MHLNWPNHSSLQQNSIPASLCSLHCPLLVSVASVSSDSLLLIILLLDPLSYSCLLNWPNKLLEGLWCSTLVVACGSKIGSASCIILVKWLLVSCPIEVRPWTPFIIRFRVSFWLNVFFIVKSVSAIPLSRSAAVAGSAPLKRSLPWDAPPSLPAIHQALYKLFLGETCLITIANTRDLATSYHHISVDESSPFIDEATTLHYNWFSLLIHYILKMRALIRYSLHLLLISGWMMGKAVFILGWCLAVQGRSIIAIYWILLQLNHWLLLFWPLRPFRVAWVSGIARSWWVLTASKWVLTMVLTAWVRFVVLLHRELNQRQFFIRWFRLASC